MDKERIKRVAKHANGPSKDAASKVTRNKETETCRVALAPEDFELYQEGR